MTSGVVAVAPRTVSVTGSVVAVRSLSARVASPQCHVSQGAVASVGIVGGGSSGRVGPVRVGGSRMRARALCAESSFISVPEVRADLSGVVRAVSGEFVAAAGPVLSGSWGVAAAARRL